VQAFRPANTTKWAATVTQQLLARHGVLTREAVAAESIPGGFGLVYPGLKAMEENGRLRRGYFVAGLGATQFALPGALDLLRSLRDAPDDVETAVLAATDPANPYGATLKWPAGADTGRGPTRSVGATVILVNGALAGYLARGERQLLTFLPDAEPERSKVARALSRVLIERARGGIESPRGMLLEEIDGAPPDAHPLKPFLAEAGFIAGAMGMQATFIGRQSPVASHALGVASHASGVASQPSTVAGRESTTVRARSKSPVSSPFARRVFESDD
jgi:ATP-dependent Lhr-like helicase